MGEQRMRSKRKGNWSCLGPELQLLLRLPQQWLLHEMCFSLNTTSLIALSALMFVVPHSVVNVTLPSPGTKS